MPSSTPVTELLKLPQSGGAMQGLGEKFSPDLFTGTGNFSIPIQCPVGRNGFQPQLNLSYSTGNGNGPFGLGWVLSVPGITRQTSKGIPNYDANDTFVLSGAEDLIPVTQPEPGVRVYRPRTEGLFASIAHHYAGAYDYWEVKSKDGLVSIYGSRDASTEKAILQDPSGGGRILAWKLTTTTDPFGNRIEYRYSRDSSHVDGPHDWDQVYLSEIRYVDYTEHGETRFLYGVKFLYTTRPDQFSDYKAGFEVRTVQRCRRIELIVNDGHVRPIRAYELAYSDDVASEDRPLNGVSLLKSIQVAGYDDLGVRHSDELPPLEFQYTRFAPKQSFGDYHRDLIKVAAGELPAFSLTHPDIELVDLSGNGLPDIIETGDVFRYWSNRGQGRFTQPRTMDVAPTVRLSQPGVQLLDADGDGRADLLSVELPLAGYYRLTFDGEWDRRSPQRYSGAPSVSLADPEVKLIDLDGDGLTDVLRSGSRFECFFNHRNSDEAWRRVEHHERRALDVFPNVSFSDKRIHTADMTGDGMQDIVLIDGRSIQYWPNLGHGRWGKRIQMAQAPDLPFNYDPRRIFFGDLDGDGLADLVYIEDGHVRLWINQSGNSWSSGVVIRGTPPTHDLAHLRLVDFLGSGTAGILWSYDANVSSRESMYFLDLTGGAKPYLLHEMNNNIGAVTRVSYAPSTRFFLKDEEDPERRWRTKLPFPVQVVARVEVVDELSRGKLSTQYHYRHGYWDGVEREFRGFACVEQRDTETFEDYHRADPLHGSQEFGRFDQDTDREKHFAPPTLTRTWFHLGALDESLIGGLELDLTNEYWGGDPALLQNHQAADSIAISDIEFRDQRDAIRALRGSLLRTELYALDQSPRKERPYSVSESCYSVREVALEDAGGPRRLIAFPHLDAQRTTRWDRGDDPLSTFTLTGDYDEFGQPQAQTSVSLPRLTAKQIETTGTVIGNYSLDETRILITHARTVYAPSPSRDEIHNRVSQIKVYELTNPPHGPDLPTDDAATALRKQLASVKQIESVFKTAAPGETRVISHVVNHYDGDVGFEGLPLNQLGTFGALTRSESLALNEAILDAAYGERRPAYLDGAATLPQNAPAGFGSHTGYRLVAADASGYEDGWYVDTKRVKFDFQDGSATPRGLVIGIKDPLGNEASVLHDRFALLPLEVTDAANLTTKAKHNYRVQQPELIEDPNGTTTHFHYTATGLLQRQFIRGLDETDAEVFGGSERNPELELEYRFRSFMDSPPDDREPISVHSRRRIHHASDNLSDESIGKREFSDGFGRVIQTRDQAEDWIFGASGDDVGLPTAAGSAASAANAKRVDESVVVSGWQIYDNKGRVIEKYEPFFSTGWEFQPGTEAQRGEHVKMFYDPLGQLIRTCNPDGSQQRIIFGKPRTPTTLSLTVLDLESTDVPASFEPSPWETYTYDANDLASLTHKRSSNVDARHRFTPASGVVDAMGRAVCQVQRNGSDPGNDWIVTRTEFDLRGNALKITDSLGRAAFRHTFDLLNRPLAIASIDAGLRTSVLDANGSLIEHRDSKGSLVLHTYDKLNRAKEIWAQNDGNGRFTLRERMLYGDDGDRALAKRKHSLGRLVNHYDEAGLVEIPAYDFKGNVLEKNRRTIADNDLANGWLADWSSNNAENALEVTSYQISSRYDALNRPVELNYPQDVAGERRKLIPTYNRAGALEAVSLGGANYITHIAYNAKGQRVLIAYGNEVMTRHAYDKKTFRLARLRTERCVFAGNANERAWTGSQNPLQDFAYTYDPAGNLISIDESTPNCGYLNSPEGRDRLTRKFIYDPIYRLLSATGRACRNPPRSLDDDPQCGFYPGAPQNFDQDNAPELTDRYTESYSYDPAGNMLELSRKIGTTAAWVRVFGMGNLLNDQWKKASNNRLTGLQNGRDPHRYKYDDNGNLIQQNSERLHTWDHADRMIGYRVQPAPNSPASIEARYLYGADGMRVKKWVKNQQTTVNTTVYIDGVFEHHRQTDGTGSRANNTLHVMDNQSRVAMVRVGATLDARDSSPQVQYIFGDHLGSSHVVLGGNNSIANSFINREEYFPYGETSFGSFARKRYRYSSKERDEESGFYYFGARYFASVLSRWISCDPALQDTDSAELQIQAYIYAQNRPFVLIDPDGREIAWFQTIDYGRVSSQQGPRKHPITGQSTNHQGMDLTAPEGTEVRALGSGVVEAIRYQEGWKKDKEGKLVKTGAGGYIVIDHGDGLKSLYMHLNVSLVSLGQKVSGGQEIALSGNTGGSTGPHLHLELHLDNKDGKDHVVLDPETLRLGDEGGFSIDPVDLAQPILEAVSNELQISPSYESEMLKPKSIKPQTPKPYTPKPASGWNPINLARSGWRPTTTPNDSTTTPSSTSESPVNNSPPSKLELRCRP